MCFWEAKEIKDTDRNGIGIGTNSYTKKHSKSRENIVSAKVLTVSRLWSISVNPGRYIFCGRDLDNEQ